MYIVEVKNTEYTRNDDIRNAWCFTLLLMICKFVYNNFRATICTTVSYFTPLFQKQCQQMRLISTCLGFVWYGIRRNTFSPSVFTIGRQGRKIKNIHFAWHTKKTKIIVQIMKVKHLFSYVIELHMKTQ